MSKAGETGRKRKYWYLLIAAIFFGRFALSVEAAPVTLASGSAVVYEQTSETSTPLQNLIQDGNFEFLGDVTAEDGSVWHAVTTPEGISGYIRGDIEIRTLQTQPETPEPTEGAEGGEPKPAGNETGAGQTAEPEAQTGQEHPGETGAAETGENAEEEGEETQEAPVMPQTIGNNRAKTYAAGALEKKIKGRAAGAEKDSAEENAGREQKVQLREKSRGADWAFRLCIVVAIFSVAVAFAFYKKLRKESGKHCASTIQEETVKKNVLKSERKRRKSRRKKNKKHGKSQKKTAPKHP